MSQKWHTAIVASSLTTLFILLEPACSETIEFIVEPAVGTISLHRMLNVTLQCRLNSTEHSYKPSWVLNFPDTNPEHYLSTSDDNDKAKLAEHGVRYYSDKALTNITIPGLVKNNQTQVLCKTFYSGETQFSDEIRIIIAGLPLPPDPTLNILSPSQLQIQWDIPFSHESDPIQRYDIQILNTSSGSKFEYNVTQNGYIFPTRGANNLKVEHCHRLMFNVTAVSTLGQSKPGKVSGGFPVAPKPFSSEIDVAVTFYGNGTPIAKVSFEAPFICDYQTSNYIIIIEDATAVSGLPTLFHQSTYTGRSRMITETFDIGLRANHTYTLTVTVRDSTFVDDISTAVNFSTTFHPLPPTSLDASSGLHLRDIWIFAGGVFTILLMTITTIVIVIFCLRKRRLKKDIAPGSTMDLMLNSMNRSRATSQRNGSQYDTPSKSAHGSALYETIDGYQKQTPAHSKATMFSWQQQEYLWKLQQQPNFESDRPGDVIEADIPYQKMHSASEQGVAGVYNPSHVMMHQGSQKPNNSQKSYSFQVESCTAAAAAGNTTVTSPIRMTDSDSDTDFHHSQSFGDHLSTTAVVNESVGTAEEDQSEYTFMSQAGTLAGQQSKLTLCTNGCVNVEDPEAHIHSNVDVVNKNGKSKDLSDCKLSTEF